jgi:creatinine amidohydrolase
MDEETMKKFPPDHAGMLESSMMMAFCPDGVDMKLFSADKWYCESAKNASLDYGNAAKQMILDRMRAILKAK